jgi:hypothetical protein
LQIGGNVEKKLLTPFGKLNAPLQWFERKAVINEQKLIKIGRSIFHSNCSINLEEPGITSFKPLCEV